MNRVLAPIVAGAALALALSGCSSVESGRITEKGYDEPYQTEDEMCVSYSTSQPGVCNVSVPVTTDHPECWRLNLDNGEDTGSVCVAKPDWDRAQVGQQWKGNPA